MLLCVPFLWKAYILEMLSSKWETRDFYPHLSDLLGRTSVSFLLKYLWPRASGMGGKKIRAGDLEFEFGSVVTGNGWFGISTICLSSWMFLKAGAQGSLCKLSVPLKEQLSCISINHGLTFLRRLTKVESMRRTGEGVSQLHGKGLWDLWESNVIWIYILLVFRCLL